MREVLIALALVVSTAAAIYDYRTARIPNWLTLPPMVVAPACYGASIGVDAALASVCALLMAGMAPYLAFRLGTMGGGDVKLLAALGATTGFDPRLGLELELLGLLLALLLAILIAGWRVLRGGGPDVRHVRLGIPIFAAAVLVLTPHLTFTWSSQ